MVLVVKANGESQVFLKEKIISTCTRNGASLKIANIIVNKIELKIYDGITTRKILQMVFSYLKSYQPAIKHQTDLRKALSLLKSKPTFERFIQILLGENGYEVTTNKIIRGKCVEHEIDAIAEKNGEKFLIEIKHHFNYHSSTGLDESRISRAVFEDVTEGFKLGLNIWDIDKAMIITNTKLSEHAKQYAKCRGILNIGWNYPRDNHLQSMIEKKKLYPITSCKGLKKEYIEKLTSNEIILLKQIITKNPKDLSQKTKIPIEKVSLIIKKAETILLNTNKK